MENKDLQAQRLKQLFAHHPKVNMFFLTSDGQAFTQKHFADAHAATLEDKSITPYTRQLTNDVLAQFKAALNAKAGKAAEATQGNESGQGVESSDGGKTDKEKAAEERVAIVAKYEALFGKKPAHNAGVEKLKNAIAEKEAELKSAEEKAQTKAAEGAESGSAKGEQTSEIQPETEGQSA